MQLPDYYQVLGVANGETPENIKRAFRKLARRYHPDVSKEKNAERRMKEINEAYDVLSDPQKRAEYDTARNAAMRGFGQNTSSDSQQEEFFRGFGNGSFHFTSNSAESFHDFGGFGEMGNIFEQIFGHAGATPSNRKAHDNATRAEIELDVEDAFTGIEREIALRVPYRDSAGRSRWRQKRLKIDIPAGVHEGKIIRLAGQGSPGTDGKGGDLLLEVRFRPHSKMRAVKRDIYMVLPLAPWEAALGAVVPVDLPTGTVKVRIPRGVQQGRHLHVPERGIPGKPPGDLILEANIVLPPADTPSAERAYQTFARETAFAPRQ